MIHKPKDHHLSIDRTRMRKLTFGGNKRLNKGITTRYIINMVAGYLNGFL